MGGKGSGGELWGVEGMYLWGFLLLFSFWPEGPLFILFYCGCAEGFPRHCLI